MGERKQQENDSPEVDGGVECSWLHGCQIEGRRDAQKELFLSTTKCLYEELHYKSLNSYHFTFIFYTFFDLRELNKSTRI